MAYGVKYRFNFDSDAGLSCRIDILQNGFSGSIKVRPLGSSPVLRMDNGGAVRGTSMEILAECQVDREFATLYTSSADEYKVEFYAGSTLKWSGFVSPELYSEPDIAPPYDVKITATDGLGELKLTKYPERGSATLLNHLTYLLSLTGLSHDIVSISSLAAGSGSSSTMLTQVSVDLDYLAGETCYDVLAALMDTMNAFITLNNEKWVIVRENDFTLRQGSVIGHRDSDGTTVGFSIREFGYMPDNDWWPVGQMSTEVVPAKKGQIIAAPNHYKDSALANSDMSADTGWTKSGGATFDSTENAYKLVPGSSIKQTVDFDDYIGYNLALRFRARNVGQGTGTEQPLVVKIHIDASGAPQTGDLYLTNEERRGTSNTGWTSDSAKRMTLELEEPVASDTEANAADFDVTVPLFRSSLRYFVLAQSIEVAFENTGSAYNQYIYSCELVKLEQVNGWENIIEIDNDARGDGEDLEIVFPRIDDDTVAGIAAFQYGVPIKSGDPVEEWSTGMFEGMDFLSLISRDRAAAMALPRIRKSGTLNVPTSDAGMPLAVQDYESLYVVESLSWNILHDELDITAVSVPDAEISVIAEVMITLPDGYSAAHGSGGGGAVSAGTGDYNSLVNLPMINGVLLKGALTSVQLGLIGTDMFELDSVSVPGKTFIKAKYDGFYSVGSVSANGVGTSESGEGTTVEWEQLQGATGAVQIATITIDGTAIPVYAPVSGGGGTTVSWGSESGGTVPLTVSGTSKTLALASALNNYLAKAGDSMAGMLRMAGNKLSLYGTSTNPDCALYANSSEQVYLTSKGNLYLSSNQGDVYVNGGKAAKVSDIPTSLSQLTDDLGNNPTHSHSQYLTITAAQSTYLPLAGGTITGNLTVNETLYSNGGAHLKSAYNDALKVDHVASGASTVWMRLMVNSSETAHIEASVDNSTYKWAILGDGSYFGGYGIGMTGKGTSGSAAGRDLVKIDNYVALRILDEQNIGTLGVTAVRIGNAYLKYDATHGALYVEGANGASMNFYATGSVAAGGVGTSEEGGSTVEWTQYQGATGAVRIATIKIDGETKDVYAPNNGGTTVSWGTETSGTVPLTVAGTAKTLVLSSALSNYLTTSDASTRYQTKITSSNKLAASLISGLPTSLSQFTDDLGSNPTHTHVQYQTTINASNKIPYSYISGTPTIPTLLSQLTGDTTHRVVTDSQISTWNGKADADHTHSQYAALNGSTSQDFSAKSLTVPSTNINGKVLIGSTALWYGSSKFNITDTWGYDTSVAITGSLDVSNAASINSNGVNTLIVNSNSSEHKTWLMFKENGNELLCFEALRDSEWYKWVLRASQGTFDSCGIALTGTGGGTQDGGDLVFLDHGTPKQILDVNNIGSVGVSCVRIGNAYLRYDSTHQALYVEGPGGIPCNLWAKGCVAAGNVGTSEPYEPEIKGIDTVKFYTESNIEQVEVSSGVYQYQVNLPNGEEYDSYVVKVTQAAYKNLYLKLPSAPIAGRRFKFYAEDGDFWLNPNGKVTSIYWGRKQAKTVINADSNPDYNNPTKLVGTSGVVTSQCANCWLFLYDGSEWRVTLTGDAY